MSSPAQLYSCVDSNYILRSPINNSTAKNHWSFSKGKRFKDPRATSDVFYDLPDPKNKRKTSFGFGKRIDLDVGKHPHNIVPSPDSYDLKGFNDINKSHKKGFFPGYGREQTAPMSFIDLQALKTPGPGRYQDHDKRETPKWSLRPRTQSQLFDISNSKFVPGPGQYQLVDNISSTGKYYTSKFTNSGSKIFNPKRSKRFSKSTTAIPGPGTYNPKNDLSSEGVYVLSKNVSAGKRFLSAKISSQSFIELAEKRASTPGPGSYRLPSDFGHYDQAPGNSLIIRTGAKSARSASRPSTARR